MLDHTMSKKEMLEHYKDEPVTDKYNLSNLEYDEENLRRIIEENPLYLQFIKKPSTHIVYIAVSLNGHAIQFVDKECSRYNSLVDVALKNRVSSLQFIEQTEEIKEKVFKYCRYPFVFIKKPTYEDFCRSLKGHFQLSKAQVEYALEKYKKGKIEYVKRIYRDENFLKYGKNIPYDILKLALKANPKYIKDIKQDEDLAKIAIKADYKVIKHIKCLTKEICLFAITVNANAYKLLPKEFKDDFLSIELLRCNGLILGFITNPSYEEIETALIQNGLAAKFVKNISSEDAMTAVKQNPLAIKYLDKQWFKACVEAVKSNNQLLKEIKDNELRKIVKEHVDEFRKIKLCKYFSEIKNEDLDANLIKLGLTKSQTISELYIDCLILEIEDSLESLTDFIYYMGLKNEQISKGRYKKVFVINHFKDFSMKNYTNDYIVYVKDIEEIISIVKDFNK